MRWGRILALVMLYLGGPALVWAVFSIYGWSLDLIERLLTIGTACAGIALMSLVMYRITTSRTSWQDGWVSAAMGLLLAAVGVLGFTRQGLLLPTILILAYVALLPSWGKALRRERQQRE